MSPSILNSAAAGARWVMMENLLRQVLGLAVFLILARLLGPEAFGLLALAAVAVAFGSLLTEGSLGDAIVQRQTLEEGFLDTAFLTALAAGLLFALLLMFSSGPVSQVLGQPQLAPLIRWLAPVVAINALCVVHQALLQRAFGYRTLAIRTGMGIAAGGTVGIGMALAGHGALSLVVQQLVQAVVNLAVLWTASSWRPGVKASQNHLRSLADFTAPLVARNFLNFVNRKSDDLLIGVVLGPVALGVYTLAYRVLQVLEELLCRGFDGVGLSTFARLQADKAALRETFLRFTNLAGTAAVPVFLGAALVAPLALPLFFGDQWQAAVPVFQWLAGAGLLHAVFHFNHAVFKAAGKPGLSLKITALNALSNLALLLVVVHIGVVAVAAAYTLRAWVLAPVGLILLGRLIGLSLCHYLQRHSVSLLAGLLMSGAVSQLEWSPGSIGDLMLQVTLGAVVYCACLGILLRRQLRVLWKNQAEAHPA